jgi:hypothetical protein
MSTRDIADSHGPSLGVIFGREGGAFGGGFVGHVDHDPFYATGFVDGGLFTCEHWYSRFRALSQEIATRNRNLPFISRRKCSPRDEWRNPTLTEGSNSEFTIYSMILVSLFHTSPLAARRRIDRSVASLLRCPASRPGMTREGRRVMLVET